MTDTAVARKDDVHDWVSSLMVTRIEKILPKEVNPERFKLLAVRAIKQTPKLWEADRASLALGLLDASDLGLEPNGALQHGWLIPYKGQAKFMIGYRGIIQIAARCGIMISAEVVHDGDEFSYQLGDNPGIHHIPNPDVEPNAEKITYAYAIATLPNGLKQRCVMTRKQINAIRAKSQSAGSESSPWNQFYAEMARKTVIRRLAKYIPLQNEQWTRMLEKDNEDYEGEEKPRILSSRRLNLGGTVAESMQPAPVADEMPEPGSAG